MRWGIEFSAMKRFSAIIEIIGINPFVHLPEKVLAAICQWVYAEKLA